MSNTNGSSQNQFKTDVAIIGSGGVGKSAITCRFVQNTFVEVYDPTIEDSYRRGITVDEEHILLSIVDTAGQEEYRAARDQQYRQCSGFVFVYSITSEASAENTIELHKQLMKVRNPIVPDEVPIVLVGNKTDLEDRREVPKDFVKSFCSVSRRENVPIVECSAKTGLNVDEVFQLMVREIKKRNKLDVSVKKKQLKCIVL
ncbi:Ras-related protein Rap [Acrasis kona]|uniref:Ras-related protein Rap n=1 Tax=Acrasis kona TaxID=1008807 RepID=A0AAW2YZS9_9EUKA